MEFKNQYLNYEEYVDLGGTLEGTPFDILEMEAQLNIDNYTFGRLKNLKNQVNEVKLCIYSIMTTLQSYADNKIANKNIASETTDGYTVSYTGITTELTKAQKKEIKNIIETYLGECKLEDGTPYLYLG
jgi:hypothetical protein